MKDLRGTLVFHGNSQLKIVTNTLFNSSNSGISTNLMKPICAVGLLTLSRSMKGATGRPSAFSRSLWKYQVKQHVMGTSSSSIHSPPPKAKILSRYLYSKARLNANPYFHECGCALGLILIIWIFGTHNWPFVQLSVPFSFRNQNRCLIMRSDGKRKLSTEVYVKAP